MEICNGIIVGNPDSEDRSVSQACTKDVLSLLIEILFF